MVWISAQSSNRLTRRRLASSRTETSLLAPDVSVSRKCCSSQVSPVKEPAESTSFVFQMKCDVDIRKNLYANVMASRNKGTQSTLTRRRTRTNHKAESVEEAMEEPRSCTHYVASVCEIGRQHLEIGSRGTRPESTLRAVDRFTHSVEVNVT